MDNPYASKSSAHAAAFELTQALIANTDLSNFVTGTATPDSKGAKAAEFVNGFFNRVLANLEKKQ